jgi:GNAT superfamily N-acetyltransferase
MTVLHATPNETSPAGTSAARADKGRHPLEAHHPAERQPMTGSIRKLWTTEHDAFREHLLRLSKDERRMRFAHAVSDAFIADYASRMSENGSVVHAYIENGEIRAVAELRKLGDSWGIDAEAAFSVEGAHQDKGLGTELMGRVIRSARNRGVVKLYMSCLAENTKMQAIARKHEADLKFEYGEVIGEIVPDGPNYFSLIAEAVEDRVGYMLAVFDLSARLHRAA